MNFDLDQVIKALNVVIPVGALFRILYLVVQISLNPDEAEGLKKRIRNTLVFVATALAATGLIDIITSAYR